MNALRSIVRILSWVSMLAFGACSLTAPAADKGGWCAAMFAALAFLEAEEANHRGSR
jgi:hypothetical protein